MQPVSLAELARPIVALSGGVDSALVAYLLKRAGTPVEALHMTNWDDDEDGYCTAREDLKAARSVADFLDIPLHHVSFAKEYREQIFSNFIELYARGLTPNPDILCNRQVKFGVCLDYAKRLGASHLATGHYASILAGPTGFELHRGVDPLKDQSYFLQHMPATALSQSVFPLGQYRKDQVRALALNAGLPVHARKDSTGICFIGERPFKEFLARYVQAEPGPIESVEGRVIGQHHGLAYYTIGQRQGLGVGGLKDRNGEAWYVARKDATRNCLVVAQGESHPALLCQQFWVTNLHWLSDATPRGLSADPTTGFPVEVQIRHRGESITGELAGLGASVSPAQAAAGLTQAGEPRVTLARPFHYVAPGQYAAFYHGSRCLGGGQISQALTLSGDIIGTSLGDVHEPNHRQSDRRVENL
jgi:tRNA-uridine 2-sulfurtransferase